MSRTKNLKTESGFTLVELMVAIVVLSIVITSLSGMYYLTQIGTVIFSTVLSSGTQTWSITRYQPLY